jgi:hypothetical protein
MNPGKLHSSFLLFFAINAERKICVDQAGPGIQKSFIRDWTKG